MDRSLLRGFAFGLLALAALVPCSRASAHPPGVADEDQAVAHEVEALHEAISRAVRRKDARRLLALYAENFTHTDASGRVEPRDERIRRALAGEAMIETAPVQELNYRIHGAAAVIVTGTSPLSNPAERQDERVRWIAIYVKNGGQWQLAASQSTRLSP